MLSFEKYYNEKAKMIENELYSIIDDEKDENIKILLEYSVGGKHFRGVLTMLTSDVLGGDTEKALKYACIVEFIQNASLIHDDVIDLDLLRRGKPTLWSIADELVKNKNVSDIVVTFIKSIENKVINTTNMILKKNIIPIAVLAGDALILKTLEIEDDNCIRNEVINVVRQMLSGVCDEVRSNESEYYYLRCIKKKTAKLFSFSTWLGWFASGKPNYPVVEIGEKIGMLYQVTDDFVDEDLPSFIDAKMLINKYYNEINNLIDKLPENEYKSIFFEVPIFMIRKLSAESKKEKYVLEFLKEGGEISE